jgi:hypothetical protein
LFDCILVRISWLASRYPQSLFRDGFFPASSFMFKTAAHRLAWPVRHAAIQAIPLDIRRISLSAAQAFVLTSFSSSFKTMIWFKAPLHRGISDPWSALMKQLDVVTHDSNVTNPFGIQMDGPLRIQAAVEMLNPKTIFPGDIGAVGSRHDA